MFFVIYKFVGSFLLSPGIILLILLIIAGYLFSHSKKIKDRKIGIISIIIAIITVFSYLISIDPIKEFIIAPLENSYEPIQDSSIYGADAIIILGGGLNKYAKLSFSSNPEDYGTPSYPALSRVVEGTRIYKRIEKNENRRVPVIVSGGKVYKNSREEAAIYAKFLESMGVLKQNIILEKESKTTLENAKYTKEICKNKNYQKIILVTSAIHMKRAVYSFQKYEMNVIPAPADYLISNASYDWNSFIPDGRNISIIKGALWEYLGTLYYKLKQK